MYQIQTTLWFQQLLQAIHQRDTLQSVFDETIPATLKNKYYVLEIRGTILKVGTHYAGYAARLRYLAPELIISLRQHHLFSHVQTLTCVVISPTN